MGEINQKGLRDQDRPVPLEQLSDSQKELIKTAENLYKVKIQ